MELDNTKGYIKPYQKFKSMLSYLRTYLAVLKAVLYQSQVAPILCKLSDFIKYHLNSTGCVEGQLLPLVPRC